MVKFIFLSSLQFFLLNVHFKRVILSSFFTYVLHSSDNFVKYFQIIFYNCSQETHSSKKVEKNRESSPSRSRKLHQCHPPLQAGSVFAMINGYFSPLFLISILILLSVFFSSAGNTHTKFFEILSPDLSIKFSICMLPIPKSSLSPFYITLGNNLNATLLYLEVNSFSSKSYSNWDFPSMI